MTTTFSNIHNVRTLPAPDTGYVCDLTITKAGETWEAMYVARPGGGGICDEVITAIDNGDFAGEILPFEGQ